MAIHFQNLEGHEFRLKHKGQKKSWLIKLILTERKKCGEINFLFADDKYVWEQNKKFLNHDTFTDIITFHNNEGDLLNGDILISTDRVEENAAQLGTAQEEELLRVMAHGVLHLCGYKDKKTTDKKTMRNKEELYLKLYRKLFPTARK